MGRQNRKIKSKRRRKRWNRFNRIAYQKLQGYSLGGLLTGALGNIEYKNIRRFNRYRGPKDRLVRGKNNNLKDSLTRTNPILELFSKWSSKVGGYQLTGEITY